MKDIDFDELDRAVSSLMGAVPKDEPKTDDATSSDIPPADTAVSSDSPEPAASNPQSDAPAASKRGRYMDMVRHFSSFILFFLPIFAPAKKLRYDLSLFHKKISSIIHYPFNPYNSFSGACSRIGGGILGAGCNLSSRGFT